MAKKYGEITREANKTLQSVCDEYVRSSNNEYSELTKQVTTFVSILIPLMALLLTSSKFEGTDDIITSRLAFLMTLSFCITLVIGSASYIINGSWWNKQSEKVSKAIDSLYTLDHKDEYAEADFVNKIFNETFTENDSGYEWLFNSAIAFFCTGIICFIIIMYRILL